MKTNAQQPTHTSGPNYYGRPFTGEVAIGEMKANQSVLRVKMHQSPESPSNQYVSTLKYDPNDAVTCFSESC